MFDSVKSSIKNAVSFMKPRIVLCLLLALAFVFSAMLVSGQINTFIIRYEGKGATVKTLSADIGAALASANISGERYKIDTAKRTGGKTEVSLLKTFSVSVSAGGKLSKIDACERDTVKDVLTCAGYKIDKYDMIEPAPGSKVSEGTCIDYVNVDYVTGSYEQAVPHSVETVYTDKMEKGKKKTAIAGKDGLEKISYTRKIVDGKVVSTKINSKVTLLAAKDAVQKVGTRRPAVKTGGRAKTGSAVTTSSKVSTVSVLKPSAPIALDAKGNPVNYKKHVTVQATAYTYTGHRCSTGVSPKPGYIAVNPRVIPYGTKMYIKSSDGRFNYGYAIAADTGGFIYSRPTNVDLFFGSLAQCNSFGRRNVEIYILN